MAMNKLFGRRQQTTAAPALTSDPYTEKSSEENDVAAHDVEKGASKGDARRGSRIDAPLRKGSIVQADGSDEDSIGIGKQIELEKDNAIKYRTCSWQKVSTHHPSVALRLNMNPVSGTCALSPSASQSWR